MSNGRLIPAEGGSLTGYIATLKFSCKIMLRLNPQHRRDDENSPKFEVFSKTAAGMEVRLGAAWEKTAKRGATPGKKFLSMMLDDPSWDTSLNVTAFPGEGANDGSYDIVWRRPRQVDRQEAGERQLVDDDLPF